MRNSGLTKEYTRHLEMRKISVLYKVENTVCTQSIYCSSESCVYEPRSGVGSVASGGSPRERMFFYR